MKKESINYVEQCTCNFSTLFSGMTLKDVNQFNTDSIMLNYPQNEENNNTNKVENNQYSLDAYYKQDNNGDTQLHVAIIRKYFQSAFNLIRMAPNPSVLDILNDDCEAPLHVAVSMHQPRTARRLVIAGANLNVENSNGDTPLHLACSNGDIYCAKALTYPVATNEVIWLGRENSLPIAKQNLEQINNDGLTCLHLTIKRGNLKLTHYLLERGANIDTQELRNGRTALHLAIEMKKFDIARLLVREFKPDLTKRTYCQFSPYQMAYIVDKKFAEELHIEHGVPRELPPESNDVSSSEDESANEDSGEEDEAEDEEDGIFLRSLMSVKPLNEKTLVNNEKSTMKE
ncbi:unnamed protein product [Trichogramma brassicae]|uniref:Uncharacterized protein n=1 Tax=Trichogramma brassicae TaxID=86971 RepID=A0A6H5I495_9HYME|nr:unnamed protein product [Trichogramma brassicae]